MILQPSVYGRRREHPKLAKTTTTDCRLLSTNGKLARRSNAVAPNKHPIPDIGRRKIQMRDIYYGRTIRWASARD